MRMLPATAVSVAMLLLTASVASAQGLAEAAAKERERRKRQSQPTKVITEDELRRAGGTVSRPGDGNVPLETEAAPAQGEEGAPAQPGAEPAEAPKTEEERRAEQQTAWRERRDQAAQKVELHREQIQSIELELQDMTGGVFTPRRAALQARLEEGQRQLAAAERELEAIESERRQAGYPE
jgi:Cu/Ag efflux protein CusF